MFKCGNCSEIVGPGIKAIKTVTGIRPRSYHNEFHREDEFGDRELIKVDSVGTEITGEELLCPRCADQQPANASALMVLSLGSFQEPLVPRFTQPMVGFAVATALDRLEHHERYERQGRTNHQDKHTAVPVIKFFVDHNKNYKF